MTLLAVLAAPAVMLLFIHHYAVNVPYWDEWDELRVVPKAYDGTLDLDLLFAQQNEHRPVTSKLASVLLAKTTHLNLVDEMYLGFAFEFFSLILVGRMLAVGLRNQAEVLIGPLAIVSSLLLFWSVAFENWTWAIASFQYHSSVFWAVLAVWALTSWRRRWAGVALACVSTSVAIFTNGIGFALIPVGILGILLCGAADKKVSWLQICVFMSVAAACAALYFRNYTSPGSGTGTVGGIRLVRVIKYFLTYLGSPFWTTRGGLALCFGVVGLVGISVCGYYIFRFMPAWFRGAIPWFLLACYSLINGAVIAYGRIDFGIEQALAPRYRSIVVLFWISLIVISSMIAVYIGPRFNRGKVMAALTVAIVLFIGGYSYLYYLGFRYIRLRSQIFAEGLPYVVDYDKAPDYRLQVFHPVPSTVRDLASKLEQYHLGPFATGPARRRAD